MKLEAQIDARGVMAILSAAERQIPFAGALALNRTAEEFQTAERERLGRVFTIRRPWVLQGVKIANQDRATKSKLSVTVQVEPQRAFLTKFEPGGTKVSRTGGSVAIPERAAFPRTHVVPKAKRPRGFKFQAYITKAGKVQFKGEHRTFILKTPEGRAIYQRTGRGAGSQIRLLYWLTRAARIPASLEFVQTARRVFAERFEVNFRGFLDHALRTAR